MILQAGDNWFSIGETLSFKSKILDEERSIIVYTPETYYYSDKQYPVMYLLDGGTHFHHASGIVQFLAKQGLMPEMIVVAVLNVDRTRDFSPTQVKEKTTTGGAGKFLKFMEKELIPFVDGNYRTGEYDVLVGHSFGGTFATYALLEKPGLFNAYIAISPYMMYDNDFVVREAKTKLKSKYNNEVQFYMTVGNEDRYFETLEEYSSIMKEKAGESVEFKYVKMMEENHGTTPYFTVFSGLKFIFAGWQLPRELLQEDLETIDSHYMEISLRYGIKVQTPELVINALGYGYLQAEDFDKAIATFKTNVERYPGSANVYDSLGEAYEKHGLPEQAANNYEKAVNLGEKNGDVSLPVYKTNLERVSKK